MDTLKKPTTHTKIKKYKVRAMLGLYVAVFVILFTPVFTPNSAYAQATKWKINKYKIVQQDPTKIRVPYSIEVASTKKRLTGEQVRVLENYFVMVGEEYQRLGFKEPQIDTLTETGDAFEIFVFDYDDTDKDGLSVTPARYGPSCSGEFLFGVTYSISKRYIRLDLSRLYSSKGIKPIRYDDIAHEMFHAIQTAYPLFKKDTKDRCKLGGWITEATAEAVGADMARTLKNVKIKEIKTGPRNYSKPLYVQHAIESTKNRAYWTASLWRYIGEYASNGKSFPPVKQNKRPDYRYLQKFFMKTIDRYNQKTELDWLDDNLTTNFGVKLANIYPNFISTFAYYVPERVAGTPKKFHERIFQGCERVTLTESVTFFDTVGLKFGKVSARCIEVFYEGPADTIDVGIYLESNQKIVDSIQHIGVQYHSLIGKKTIKVLKSTPGSLPSGKSFGDWTFQNVPFRKPSKIAKSNVFIISNITDKASDTHTNPIVSFRVSYATSEGNVTVNQTGGP